MKKFISIVLILCLFLSSMVILTDLTEADSSSRANQPPTITTTNVLTAYVGNYYSVNYTATDPDTNQSSLVWNWLTNSTWLSFTSSQELKGTPTSTGVCWVNISVTDGTSYDYAVFYITVKSGSPPSNSPPTITTTNVITAYVGKYYSVNYTATDPDTNQSSLVWGWNTNSTWLSFSSTQELKGTPTSTGVCWVNISVTDGTSYDYAVFYISVQSGSPPSNQPPKITTMNVITAYVGKFYYVNYTATDPDTNQSALIWRWTTNSTWLTFSASQMLSGTPTSTGVCWVNISVTDGTSFDYAVFYITVKPANSPPSNKGPKITTANVLTAYVGKLYSVNYTATDPDTNQSSLVWTFKTNSTWLTFSVYQVLSGTPTKTGVCWVNISVTDGTNYDYAVFYITVKSGSPPPSNKGPTITTRDVLTAYVGKLYSVQYVATDPDTNQSSLVWSWKTNSTWLTFSSSQVLSGTPTKTGVCWVNISVTDGTSYDYAVFYLTVKPANSQPPSNKGPKITTTNVLTAYVGKLYSVQYAATDPDTNQSSLIWRWTTNSTWLTFSASQLLSGTPTKTGVCWVNISVTDGVSYDYAVFYIVVKQSNSSNSYVSYTNIEPGEKELPTDTSRISIGFTEPMDQTAVESALSISPETGYTLIWNEDNTILTIVLNEKLSSGTDYTVTIDDSAEDSYGLKLNSDYLLEFTTESSTVDKDDTDGGDKGKGTEGVQSGTSSVQMFGLLAAVFIIIVILLAFLFVVRNRRSVKKVSDDERVDFESLHISNGNDLETVSVSDLEASDRIDTIFEDAKLEAFGPDKPSSALESKETMVDGLRKKYESNEISKETYDEALDILSELPGKK